ncbi:MAG: hypothetical protein HYU66_06825 [Armatimonadetes bacterium]|nr:hypothetical protein [Armatimonadota bacterium]
MTLDPNLCLPLLLGLSAVQLVLLGGLWLTVRRRLSQAAGRQAARELVGELSPAIDRLAAELAEEQRRLAALSERLESALAGAEATAPVRSGAAARDEARRLLEAGRDLVEVCHTTGLPDGEVRLLANLARVRGHES